jgi:DNA modification methylase
LGRGEGLTYGISHAGWEKSSETGRNSGDRTEGKTSLFDPVLCELAYRWFSAPGDRVLDPFAGGSVRGIVASWLARHYTGIDIRSEQIEANSDQMHIADVAHAPRWLMGDARDIEPNETHDEYDLVFTCPPYADLEVYSDDPRDLSTMLYDTFLREYQRALAGAASVLRDDRYFVVVIGDARDKRSSDGRYYGLVADTINVARDIGLSLYNDMVLMTPVGSVRLTVTRQFEQSRKIGRIHQYVLVFVKGDGRRATQRMNEGVEVAGPRSERDPAEESQSPQGCESPEDWWSQ